MSNENYLLNEQKLDVLIKDFMLKVADKENSVSKVLEKKTLDPILYAVEFARAGGNSWVESETSYKIRKQREMQIGDLREQLFGLLPGWQVLKREEGKPDLVCESKKLIVELKSRVDTVKGEDQKSIYDKMLKNVTGGYRGYTALYAYWVDKTRKRMERPERFTPPDNSTGQHRPSDERILKVDGPMLWAIAVDPDQGLQPPYSQPDAIFSVYHQLFEAINKYAKEPISDVTMRDLMALAKRNFDKTL